MSLAPTVPVEGLRPPDQGPENNNRPTRPKLRFWDRIKFILLFVVVWFMLVWAAVASNPILPFVDAMRLQVEESAWLLVLTGIELLRQVHFLISEHSSAYHRFWTNKVFGGSERFAHRRFSDWTRFRLARIFKWLLTFSLIIVVVGAFMDISPVLAIFQLPALLWQAMPFVAQLAFAFFFVIFQFVGLFWFLSRGGVETYYPDDIKTRFTDVWGQDQVVERVKENIVFLERPQEIEARGGYVPSGLLLWGPPGTGKTLMAEAVAGETGKPYVFVDPGAFTNMFMGVGILKVKSLFRKLRKLALRYGGVIVFFDEADALGSRGALAQQGPGFPRGMTPVPTFTAGCNGFSYLSEEARYIVAHDDRPPSVEDAAEPVRRKRFVAGMGMGGGGGMGTLQALLTELSGLKKPRGFINRYVRRMLGMRPKPPPKYRILVMMATNLPEALDEALLRPGRIDRIYKVGYPSKAGRVRTYQGYFDKVRHELTEANIDKLATITPYATGATIKDLVNEALITAIRDGREVITWADVIKSKQLKELGPPEDVEYIERERHAVAVHEACHAIIAYRVQRDLQIDLATIEKGSTYLGMVSSVRPEDQFTKWRSDLEADIHVSLASLAGERMFFDGDSSSGVSGDLHSATAVATGMEALYGMGSTVSSLTAAKVFETGAPGGLPKTGTQGIEAAGIRRLADRIEDNLANLLEKTARMLRENRREILMLAHALEAHKTITGDDVAAIVEGRPGPKVDGTGYHDPGFIAQLEAFHNAAVLAHQGHSKIAIPLPAAPVHPTAQWQAPQLGVLAEPAVTADVTEPRFWSSNYGSPIVDSAKGSGGNGGHAAESPEAPAAGGPLQEETTELPTLPEQGETSGEPRS